MLSSSNGQKILTISFRKLNFTQRINIFVDLSNSSMINAIKYNMR